MQNRVVLRNRGEREWVEIILVGRRHLVAMLDPQDLPMVSKNRWGFHPRGVFDHKTNQLLTHVLFPDADTVFFRNQNRLDCRRENLVTSRDESTLGSIRRRRSASGAKGVYFDAVRGAYVAYCKCGGVQVYGYFRVSDYPSAAKAEEAARGQRRAFRRMSFEEMVAWKARKTHISDAELMLGESAASKIAERVGHDPVAAALKGFHAGFIASRIVRAGEMSRLIENGGFRHREAVAA